jgi:pyruvate/2-oxoglutarate dehydrogenase complex dihydrolipoamide acyltransferase (E2) component
MEIGAPIARMEVAVVPETAAPQPVAVTATPAALAPAETTAPSPALPAARTLPDIVIPPRTRAYCRELNLSDEEMRGIPAPSGKLLPTDVDAYLKAKKNGGTPAEAVPTEPPAYVERPLSQHHRTLIYRLKRSQQMVVPATARRHVVWGGIRRTAESLRAGGAGPQPSSFQTFAYCVVQAVKEHPKFKSVLIGEAALREYAHLNLGIAVGMPNGELTLAVVPEADTLDFAGFVTTLQEKIRRAREGEDQATETTQLLLTYMGPYEIIDAVPVLVAPAVAVLFIGSTFEQNGQTLANLALTFDHRLIQGIEAAEFLRTIVGKVEQVGVLTGTIQVDNDAPRD